MDWMNIIAAVLSLGLMGLLFGAVLAVASRVFEVKTDERIPQIIESLPGANCGGCGFAGCSAYANAIVEGKAGCGCCPVGGEETAKKIAGMGKSRSEPAYTGEHIKVFDFFLTQ